MADDTGLEYSMRLHEQKEVFAELIENSAEIIGLPQVYVEKDYWVTNALKHLSESGCSEQAIFKGGTSLSKAYKLIHRFSEDIDLAVIAGHLRDGPRKKLLKQIEEATSTGLIPIESDSRISKGSKYRKTVYRYPRHTTEEEFGQASAELLIEVNAFTTPEPLEILPIQTIIADALMSQGREDLIEDYGLRAFPVQVLSIRRTLVEKLLGIVKDSYYDDPVGRLSNRVRHLYDICQILKRKEHQEFLAGEDFLALCTACIEDERSGGFERAECLEYPLSQAPLFEQFEKWSPALRQTYENVFSQFVYGDLPAMSEIDETIALIGRRFK